MGKNKTIRKRAHKRTSKNSSRSTRLQNKTKNTKKKGRKLDLHARKRRYDPKNKCKGMKYPAPKSDPRYCRPLRLPIE